MSTSGAPQLAGTRTYQHHHLDSTRWEHVRFRDDDIVVSTPYKTGTTWTQRILAALLHGPDHPLDRELSPWIDARFWGPIEPIVQAFDQQRHRRFMKSHLALDGIAWDERVSYIIVGRDPRDIFMSLLNHYGSYTDLAYASLNDEGNPGEHIPRFNGDVQAFWKAWIGRGWFEWEDDGWPFWSALHHLETWWTARHEPNVALVHYTDLLTDPSTEVERIARFLEIDRTAEELQRVVDVSSFSQMKEQMIAREEGTGPGGQFFEGGARTFMNKGTNGRWRDVLTNSELSAYEDRMERLDPSFRSWLESGRFSVAPAVAPAAHR